jgi:hypothetical protein
MRLERFWGHLSEKPLHTKGSRLKSITKIDDDPNGIKIVNWLRVLGTAELPHIDQGVRQQFHAKMSLLNMFKT